MKRPLKFWITGISGTAVEMTALFALSRFVFDTDAAVYLAAPAVSFELAVLNNYSISYFWVWNDRKKTGKLPYLRKLPKYNITCLAAFAVKMFFLLLFRRLFGWDVLICNLAALCCFADPPHKGEGSRGRRHHPKTTAAVVLLKSAAQRPDLVLL